MNTLFKPLLFLGIAILLGTGCVKQQPKSFSFAFYNIENLFDTIDNHNVADESYLPTSKVAWNTERFNHKLDNIARVMSSIEPDGFPALFGICEVENMGVVMELIKHPDLRGGNYRIIHKNSPDERGIDVALLYNPEVFAPTDVKFIHPELWEKDDSIIKQVLTRDILYTKGIVMDRDTIHLFVNHWVSRWGGQERTEPHRIKIAEIIRSFADSILEVVPEANIIIAGDLNDNPTDISISENLMALMPDNNPDFTNLYNLSLRQYKEEGKGSLYYKSWDMFDQIIVSGALLSPVGRMEVSSVDQVVFKEEWMLYQPKKGPARPSRTSSGRNYYGGFSDHLPVMVKINIK